MVSHTNKSVGDLNSNGEHLENVSQDNDIICDPKQNNYGVGVERGREQWGICLGMKYTLQNDDDSQKKWADSLASSEGLVADVDACVQCN